MWIFAALKRAQVFLIPLQAALVMFGMGAALPLRDFIAVFRQPSGLLLGCGIQWIYVPLLAKTLVVLYGFDHPWAVGVLLVAVSPGGATSNLMTFLARGNAPLSVGITTITTLAALPLIPATLALLVGGSLPANFALPAGLIIRDVLLFVIAPLFLGVFTHRFAEKAADPLSRWAINLSVALVVIIALGAVGSGQVKILDYGLLPPLQLFSFLTLLFLSVPFICQLLGCYDDDTVAISIEVLMRNGAIALLLTRYFFVGLPEFGPMFYAVIVLAGFTVVYPLLIVLLHRRGKRFTIWARSRLRALS